MKTKTKRIAPWNIKPGMRIHLPVFPGVSAYSLEVTRVQKTRGTFTGASAWRVYYRDPFSAMPETFELFHGRMKCHSGSILPAQKATVEV